LEEAKKHPYWKQFKAFCESRRGTPTLKGFNTWIEKQPAPPPQKSSSNNGATSAAYQAALRASQEQHDREEGILTT